MVITLNETEIKFMTKALLLAAKETKRQMQTGYLKEEVGRTRLQVYKDIRLRLAQEENK